MSSNFGPSFGEQPPVVQPNPMQGKPMQANPFGEQPSSANPYAAPNTYGYMQAQPEYTGGVFRLNTNQLVIHRQAVLPARCIKTGEPAETAVTKKLYWHHPAFYAIILLHVLIYAVVALIVRKSMTFAFPLTLRARGKLRMRIAIGVICLLSAIGAMIGGFTLANNQGQGGEVFGVAGVILFFALFITSIVFFYMSRLVTPTKITDQFTVVKGVSPAFLAGVPDWPYGPHVP